jgi:colicin import membrane protein
VSNYARLTGPERATQEALQQAAASRAEQDAAAAATRDAARQRVEQAERTQREQEAAVARAAAEDAQQAHAAAELAADKQQARTAWLQHGGDPASFDQEWPRLRAERVQARMRSAEVQAAATFRGIWQG